MPHADPVKRKEYAKAYNQRDYVKVKKKEYTTEYVKRNYEIVKKKHCEHSKKYRKENPEKVNENKSKRRALEIRTSKFEINNYGNTLKLFKLSNKKTKETGRKYHVDHIIPLLGRLVSGFHVSGNLRVVLADTNWRKNNRYIARDELLIQRRMIKTWKANGVKFKLYKPKKGAKCIL